MRHVSRHDKLGVDNIACPGVRVRSSVLGRETVVGVLEDEALDLEVGVFVGEFELNVLVCVVSIEVSVEVSVDI